MLGQLFPTFSPFHYIWEKWYTHISNKGSIQSSNSHPGETGKSNKNLDEVGYGEKFGKQPRMSYFLPSPQPLCPVWNEPALCHTSSCGPTASILPLHSTWCITTVVVSWKLYSWCFIPNWPQLPSSYKKKYTAFKAIPYLTQIHLPSSFVISPLALSSPYPSCIIHIFPPLSSLKGRDLGCSHCGCHITKPTAQHT